MRNLKIIMLWRLEPHLRPRALASISVIALCGLVSLAPAQSPLPDSFNPVGNSTVQALAVQADGKILVGGAFTTLGGQPRNRIARLSGPRDKQPSLLPRNVVAVNFPAMFCDRDPLHEGMIDPLIEMNRQWSGKNFKRGKANPDGHPTVLE